MSMLLQTINYEKIGVEVTKFLLLFSVYLLVIHIVFILESKLNSNIFVSVWVTARCLDIV